METLRLSSVQGLVFSLIICFTLQAQNLILWDDDYQTETKAYITRVETDGGTVINKSYLDAFIINAKAKGYYDSLVTVIDANFGVKKDANGKVTKVYDLLGIKDYARTDTAKAPSLVLSDLGGKAGLKFDGSDDFMVTGNLTVTTAQPFSSIMVVKSLATNTNKNFVDNQTTRFILFIGSGVFSAYTGTTLADTSTITTNIPFIYSTIQSGTSSKIYKNNVLKVTGNSNTGSWGRVEGDVYSLGAYYTGTQAVNAMIYSFIVKKGIGNIDVINAFLNSNYLVY